MKNAILIPGRPNKDEHYDPARPSNSEDHWFSWLKRQLILKDIHAVSIEPPFPFRPRYNEWKKEFERFDITADTILVGHSCGGGFLVRWLSEHPTVKVGKVVLVAPWINPDNNPRSDTADFFSFEIDSMLADRTKRLTIFSSDNDHLSVQETVKTLKASLKNIDYKEFHNYGHFCRSDLRTDAFPELLECLVESPTKSRIIIVNNQDEIIGHKERGTLKKSDIYRVSALWVKNSEGDILLAQRKFTKSHDPGKWGPAVAGTVDEGETYEDNIIKETEEEIGLKDVTPVQGPKVRIAGEYNYFNQWYTLVVDMPIENFVIQEEEVEQLKWFTRDELNEELRQHPENYLKGLDWPLEHL